jgi:hypothetical protein
VLVKDDMTHRGLREFLNGSANIVLYDNIKNQDTPHVQYVYHVSVVIIQPCYDHHSNSCHDEESKRPTLQINSDFFWKKRLSKVQRHLRPMPSSSSGTRQGKYSADD